MLDDLRQLQTLFGYDEQLLIVKQSWWTHGHWWPLHDNESWDEWSRFVIKLTGLIVSAFAVSLGAPFWFDLLQKVTNLRTSGTTPEERKKREKTTAHT